MGVHLQRLGDLRMAEPLRDDLYRDAGRQQQLRTRMPQAVGRDRSHASRLREVAEGVPGERETRLPERRRRRLQVGRFLREDQPVVLTVGSTVMRVADVASADVSPAGRLGSTPGCPLASPRIHRAPRP